MVLIDLYFIFRDNIEFFFKHFSVSIYEVTCFDRNNTDKTK